MSGFLSSLGRSGGNKSRGGGGASSNSSGAPSPSTPLAADLFSIPTHAATPAHLDMEIGDGADDDGQGGAAALGDASGHVSDPSTLDSQASSPRGRPAPGTRAKRAYVPPPTPPDASMMPPMGLPSLQHPHPSHHHIAYDAAAALYAPPPPPQQQQQPMQAVVLPPSMPASSSASSYATQLAHAASTSSKASGQSTPKARSGSLITAVGEGAGGSPEAPAVPPVPPLPPQHQPTIRAAPFPRGAGAEGLLTPQQQQQQQSALPPSYEAHRFPDAPPPLGPGVGAGGQGRAAGRFPRWRGWLEKRAQERHYERMDALARGLPDPGAVARKKSWGPAVNDANALATDEGVEEGGYEGGQRRGAPTPPPIPGPLHVHEFGSRFLPHLTSQPLCAVLLDIPHPPPAMPTGMAPPRLGTRFGSQAKRVVLLVGTEEGLYAVETRKESSAAREESLAGSSRNGGSESKRKWNGQIRCVEVWSGLGVYQMAVLCSSSQDASGRSATSSLPFFGAPRRPDATASNGILLGLCAPARRSKSSSARTTFSQLSSQLGSQASSFFEGGGGGDNVGSATPGHGHSSGMQDAGASFSAPQWGAGAGGGPNRATPPSGTGRMRMWNLDGLRGVVAYALDGPSSRPLDLAESVKRSKSAKHSKLSSKIRKAWASLGDPSSEREARRNSRRSASELQSAADAVRKSALNGWSGAAPAAAGASGRRRSMDSASSSEGSAGEEGAFAGDAPLSPASRAARGLPPLNPEEAAYQRALKAALNFVPISLPGQAPQRSDAGGSGGALFGSFGGGGGDDEDGSGIGGSVSRSQSSKGKDRESSASHHQSSSNGGGGSSGTSSHSKAGVLFFSVYEAGEGHKAKGTWYLGLATAHKSLLIYEAMPPKRGASRAWTFLRELWCPFSPKAFTFTYCQIQAHDREGLTRSATVVRQSRSRDGGATGTVGGHSRQASAVPYSSVLRPQYQGGDAGPIGWAGADLSVALCLGSRLVVIRVSDSNVRELELRPSPSRDGAFLGRPGSRRGSEGVDQQLAGITDVPLTQLSSKGSHRRSIEALGTVSSTGSTGSGTRKEPKEVWAGFTHVEARILVLQEHEDDDGAGPNAAAAAAAALGSLMPSRPTLSRSASDYPFASSSTASSTREGSLAPPKPGPIPAVARWKGEVAPPLSRKGSIPLTDKDLPPAPAPQSLDFAPRQTQSAAGHLDARLLVDDSDSDSDDSDGASSGFGLPNRLYAVSLRDPGAAGGGSPGAGAGANASASSDPELLSRHRERRRAAKLADAARDAGKLISVSLCIVTKGASSQILPSPLPVDLDKPKPLEILQWAETPQAVHAWARIVGLERNRSAGSVSTTSLSSLSGLNTNPSGAATPGGGSNGLRAAGANSPTPSSTTSSSASREVVLHLNVTALAFLASRRIEMRRRLVKCPYLLPFAVERDCALSLHPAPRGGEGDDEDGEDEAIVDPEVRQSLEESGASHDVELEYLGGSLVVVPQAGGSPANASCAGRIKRPWEAAGDGGAWAFQWRNGGDFRLFFVGAEV